MRSLRAAAALLGSLESSDRRWVLSRLTANERRSLQHIAPFVPKGIRGNVDDVRAMLSACLAASGAEPQPESEASGSWTPAQINAVFSQAPEWLRSLAPSLLNESAESRQEHSGTRQDGMNAVAPEFLVLARRALGGYMAQSGSRSLAVDAASVRQAQP